MIQSYNENTFIGEVKKLDKKGAGLVTVRRENKHGKIKNQTYAVPYTLPNEQVEASLVPPYRNKVAYPDQILEKHPDRIEAACPHFGRCGGCSWQHWTYEAQLNEKTNLVRSLLEEQGFDPNLAHPTLAAESEWGYRNKMEFTFSPEGELGLHEQRNFRKIIPLETCLIASNAMVEVSMEIANWARRNKLAGYDKETHIGLLRSVLVRHSRSTGEMMFAIFATEDVIKEADELVALFEEKYPNVKSFLWIKNNQLSDAMHADEQTLLLGREYIFDTLAGFHYRIWFDTFFQTNPVQAERLVELALEMAKPQKTESMIDLFCGVGTFSLPFAKEVEKLAGIEIVETSIISANRNAKDNDIHNTLFYTSDVRRGLSQVIEEFGIPDLFLLDPPRSGAGGKVMRRIGRAQPGRIVYVSCNPHTFVTDIKHLEPFGYRLEQVQPVDLFPHTYHVELVALMSREETLI